MGRTLEKPAAIVNITGGSTPAHHYDQRHNPAHDRNDSLAPEGNTRAHGNSVETGHSSLADTRNTDDSRHSNKGPEPYRPLYDNLRNPSNKARKQTQPSQEQR